MTEAEASLKRRKRGPTTLQVPRLSAGSRWSRMSEPREAPGRPMQHLGAASQRRLLRVERGHEICPLGTGPTVAACPAAAPQETCAGQAIPAVSDSPLPVRKSRQSEGPTDESPSAGPRKVSLRDGHPGWHCSALPAPCCVTSPPVARTQPLGLLALCPSREAGAAEYLPMCFPAAHPDRQPATHQGRLTAMALSPHRKSQRPLADVPPWYDLVAHAFSPNPYRADPPL
mmetsp:Transcript_37693/g.74837  ORF Transcript_37693/g.74837 Transcript_37693/m.74837 type:complete len:229 (-) Transcript_37693:33-719(-)